jgi:three-Cys-motif partner protein
MIAISVLKDAQKRIYDQTGKMRRIRCFFAENNVETFRQLREAAVPYHTPSESFEIKNYCGKFQDAVHEIQAFIGSSFPLIFIDPTGWTGYPLEKIKPLFHRPKCEVLINFMYEFVNRFAQSNVDEIVTSFDAVLGGPNWRDRLDPNLPSGLAVEKLFRETLKSAGNFDFVISAKIDKATAERPHFFMAYGTKSADGLIAFRETEYHALREHERNRANAKEKKREERSKIADLFASHHAHMQEETIDEIVAKHKARASQDLLERLHLEGPFDFSAVVNRLLETYMLRETNAKDICVDLAKAGKIENTWSGASRKPSSSTVIKIKIDG